jgi:hypothetical protein
MRCALVLFNNAAFKGIFRVQVLESAGIDAEEFLEHAAAESAFGCGDDDALEFDGAGVLVDAAQDCVGLQLAPLGFADVVASVSACERGEVTFCAPLADKLPGKWCALNGENDRDVGWSCGGESSGSISL